MRTKALLAAAILAAGLASSMAQNVYSLNVVGYVNQTVTANTWYMWGNPFSTGGDEGTGSVLTNMVSTAPSPNINDWAGATVYGFVGGSYSSVADTYFGGYGWYPGDVNPDGGVDLTPGNGFFFFAPTNGTVTFVGTVVTTNTFNLAGNAASLVASAFPVSTNLVALGLAGNASDVVYRFNQSVFGGYDEGTTFFGGYGWYDGDPQATGNDTGINGPALNVGEAVFYINANPTVNWKQAFTVN